jgi:DNA-binding NarL/FixJ family response regulator
MTYSTDFIRSVAKSIGLQPHQPPPVKIKLVGVGRGNNGARLSDEECERVGELLRLGHTKKSVAEFYLTSEKTLRNYIKRGKIRITPLPPRIDK